MAAYELSIVENLYADNTIIERTEDAFILLEKVWQQTLLISLASLPRKCKTSFNRPPPLKPKSHCDKKDIKHVFYFSDYPSNSITYRSLHQLMEKSHQIM